MHGWVVGEKNQGEGSLIASGKGRGGDFEKKRGSRGEKNLADPDGEAKDQRS